jgi:ArsR family transcriptional regulator
VLLFHTLTYIEHPERVLAECARVLRPAGKLVLLCLDEHQQSEVTAPYGERHHGFSRGAIAELIAKAGLGLRGVEVAAREVRKPRLQVMLAVAQKPARA